MVNKKQHVYSTTSPIQVKEHKINNKQHLASQIPTSRVKYEAHICREGWVHKYQ